MSKSPSNEKEKPLAHPNTNGSQLTTTFAEVIEYSTPSNLQTQPHQEQLLKDLNQKDIKQHLASNTSQQDGKQERGHDSADLGKRGSEPRAHPSDARREDLTS